MRVAVIGTGYVGQAYLRALHFLGYHPLALSRSWIDYYDQDKLRFCLKEYKADLVINCAGYTGNTVDDCALNNDECRDANLILPLKVALLCNRLSVPMIHISSGCIYDGGGQECFIESDAPNFTRHAYQHYKRTAEIEIQKSWENAWIFRIRMPFNHLPHPRNWLMKLCKYDRILDGLNSVTFLDQFCLRSIQVVQKASPGIYHACESSPVTTAQVARMLFDAGLRKKAVELFPEPDFAMSGHVPRSAAVLDSSKFEQAYGAPFGDPLVALRWCIDILAGQKAPSV